MKKGIAFIFDRIKNLTSSIINYPALSRRRYDNDITRAEEAVNNDLLKLFVIEDDRKKSVNEDIKKMISYYNNLTDQIETRRSRLIESSWQTFTILIAASGLLIAANLSLYALIPILSIFSIQIIAAILKLHEYGVQSGYRYPFIFSKYGNKWKWFYYGNKFIESINSNPFRKRKIQSDTIHYLKGLDLVLDNYANETIDQELTDNIQQLYLLQVHNYYKNRFYLRLNNYGIYANRISFVLLSIYLGVFLGNCIYKFIW